jgi:hypothetical protein
MEDSWIYVENLGLRVQGSRVQGIGFRALDLGG